ncbi:MAG: RluA family pseudouridine synthase [Candidatus Andersenbacteria bacterium]
MSAKKQNKPAPRLIFTDEQLIVLDKPAGLAVHRAPTEKKHEANLVDWLLERYPELRGVGEDPDRPGIVHRLDRDTSGVLVVARTPTAFTKLKAAFKDRHVQKKYLTLVYGRVPWEHTTAELSIRRTGSGTFGARHPNDVATLADQTLYRPARTDFVVQKRFADTTLLEAHPKTGRTHQIRVHLKALGYPVVGDQLYAPKKLVAASAQQGLTRHFLHAAQLNFVHPVSGRGVTFIAPLPLELKNFLAQIK